MDITIKRYIYEKNVSTQKKTEKQGARFQKENGFGCGQKRIEEKKKQGQKEAFGVIDFYGEIS